MKYATHLDRQQLQQRHLFNKLQMLVLFLAMAVFLGLVGYWIIGSWLGLLAASLVIVLFVLVLVLPLVLLGDIQVFLIPFLVLIVAPTLSALLQLAISRNREYEADLSAAQLMGDPQPLIEALHRLDQAEGLLGALFWCHKRA